MPADIFPSFARGEISPSLWGRVDTAVYHVALATARNIVVRPTGGALNRAGFLFLGPCADHTQAGCVIPFKYKTTDTYALVFEDEIMRVIRNDALVLETAVAITAATKADPIVVTAAGHGYSNGDLVAISGVVGMTEINGRYFIVANKDATTFELTNAYTGADVDGTGYTTYTSGGTAARVYTLDTPYAVDDLPTLKFVQSADTMTLTHPSYDPYELTRTAHNAWTITLATYLPEQASPTAVSVAQSGAAGATTYKYQVTAVNKDTLEESLPALNTTAKVITDITAADPAVVTSNGHGFANGDEVGINAVVGMTELNGRRFKVASQAANTFELEGEDSSDYTAYGSAGTAARTHAQLTNGNATLSTSNYNTVSFTAATEASRYRIYRWNAGLWGLLAETTEASYVDDGSATADYDTAPPEFREPFYAADSKPATASYYEQRAVLGGTNSRPDTSYYSVTGAYHNMNVSTPGQDADAIVATLTSREVNEIRHYVPLNDLLILTSGSEWKVNSSGDASGFTASTLRQKPQSEWGAGHQRPVVLGSTVLYVQENDAVVRSLGYALDIDGYTGTDVTLLADHLFETYSILNNGLAHARGRHPLTAALREDGQAGILTFEKTQEVIAWTHWDTPGGNGKIEAIAGVRPSATEKDEAFYMIVRRTLPSGHTVRLLERTHSRKFTDVRDCFFVDSGATYDEPVAITGVSLADPCVVTATSHGFSDGDEVDISDIVWVADEDDVGTLTQPDQLNRRRYTVTNKATHTFQLTDETGTVVDSSTFSAYVEGGYARKVVSTISGFDHLEGHDDLVALADGNVIRNVEVVDGRITLTRGASRVHAGLPYVSDLETLDIEAKTGGTLQGNKTHIAQVTVRFRNSRGLWIGPDKGRLVEMKQRENENYGDPTALLTGDKTIILKPNWGNGRLFLRQRDPLPMEITAIIPQKAGTHK